jgi:hypothetical protein
MGITASAQFGFDRRRLSLSLRKLPGMPALFSEDMRLDAEYELGLGGRQVKALADWLKWCGLAVRSGGSMQLTSFGRVLLDSDPTLEQPTSWLALHHRLAGERKGATAYWLTFRKTLEKINREELISLMKREEPGRRDRTYEDAYRNVAQILANPEMSETAQIVRPQGSDYLRVANPPTVRAPFVAWVLADWRASLLSVQTVGLTELLAENGPARPFRMTDDFLAGLLQEIAANEYGQWMTFSRTAGLDSVAFLSNPDPDQLLAAAVTP